MTMTYPIRTITADEFDALCEVPAQAFLETWPHEALEREQQVIEYDRTIAAFDGQLMAGSASAYSFRLTVPGGAVPAAGVTMVAVLPTHRRRGILTGLMGHLISDAQGRGEPVAILFASEAAIYGRFGFGLASMHQRLTIRRGEGRVSLGPTVPSSTGPGPGRLRLRTADPGQVTAELAKVYDAELGQRPGLLARDDRWWGYLLSDHPAARPSGQSQLRCLIAEDDAGPRGYALYRTQLAWGEDHLAAGTLRVRELVSADPAATAALWADLLSRDLVGEVIAAVRPMDDPLLAMLADPRRARPAPADNLWLRLIDVPAALRERRYAAAADLVLEVIDPLIGANDCRWRLSTAGGLAAGPASCERTSGPPDVRLTVQALGAVYLGGGSLSQLAAAGHAAEVTPGSLAALAAAMSWARAPHCGTMF